MVMISRKGRHSTVVLVKVLLQEEDDDEELLKLRLAALSSAYNRNIDIAKESSASEEKDNKSDLQNVDESKSRKKKTKQPKEVIFRVISDRIPPALHQFI